MANSKPIKPKPLNVNKMVGLVAPSARPVSQLEVNRCVQVVEKLRFKARLGKHVLCSHGYLAGDDKERLSDLYEAFESSNLDGIFFLRGGYGALRLLPHLNYKALIEKPKLIMGSGDATSILLTIHQKTNLNVFYGPNLDDIKSGAFLKLIKFQLSHGNEITKFPLEFGPAYGLKGAEGIEYAPVFHNFADEVKGRITGGNLTSVASMLGTPYEVSFKNKIVFLNDQNERSDILMRWIVQLTLAGKLQEASAVVFGQFNNCDSRGAYSMNSIQDMITEHMDKLKIPYAVGFPMNEGGLPNPLPIGVFAKIDPKEGVLKYLECPTGK